MSATTTITFGRRLDGSPAEIKLSDAEADVFERAEITRPSCSSCGALRYVSGWSVSC